MIYTGDGHEDSQQQQLCTAVGTDADVDVRVKILRQASNRSIIGQYIEFCKIYSNQQRKKGMGKEAIQATIKISLEKGVLVDFLRHHQAEVEAVMTDQFKQEKIFEQIRKEDRKEGKQEGLAFALANLMKNQNISLEAAMKILGLPLSDRAQYAKMVGAN